MRSVLADIEVRTAKTELWDCKKIFIDKSVIFTKIKVMPMN